MQIDWTGKTALVTGGNTMTGETAEINGGVWFK